MPDRRGATPLLCATLALLVLTPGCAETKAERDVPERLFEPGELSTAIDDAIGYLVGACGDDGEFVYRINLDPQVTHKRKYNLLRHAGAIYALGQANRRDADPEIVNAMKRAAGFLQREAVGPVPEQQDMLTVWSRDAVNNSGGPDVAKLGGTGLALVALLTLEQLAPDTTDLEDLRALGRFIRYMQKDDGSFYSKFHPDLGRDDSWTSLYYPGEAALGMVMLYERDPAAEWLDSATRALGYLATDRKGQPEVPADHWALIATARLLAMKDSGGGEIDRDLLVAHGEQIVENILRSQPTPTAQHLLGSHVLDGRTAPTATRLEGLIAAIDFLPESKGGLQRRVMRSLETGIDFLLRAQVDDEKHRGAMPRAIRRLDAREPFASASFNRRATEVRIDYVQHALSAYIGYERLAYEAPARNASAGSTSAEP